MGKLSENTWVRGSLVIGAVSLAFIAGSWFNSVNASMLKVDKLEQAVIVLTELVKDIRRGK